MTHDLVVSRAMLLDQVLRASVDQIPYFDIDAYDSRETSRAR